MYFQYQFIRQRFNKYKLPLHYITLRKNFQCFI
nr:MAG TPA: hypothetical protein [Caudoviricetes sp.]